MKTDVSKALDECIARVNGGESIEACLDQYADMREQIEPLLRAGLFISTTPKAVPSDEFRKTCKGRLMARLRQEALQSETKNTGDNLSLLGELTAAWQGFCQAFGRAGKIAVPVTVALFLLFVTASGVFSFLSPSAASSDLASQCTLSMLGGKIEVLDSGADEWQSGTEGMTLSAGMHVRTAPESQALLTFFEGTTV